jgi:hypothetical protein
VAIDFASMLLQPTKASPWDLSPSGAGTARENLKLARERFDWERKRAEENDRLERERLKAEEAKARLAAEATKEAKLREDRLKAYGDFTKATGEGNVEGAQAMVPLLHSLGMDIELEGEEGGLPRYRVGMDAAAAQAEEDQRAAQTSPYGGEAPAGAAGSFEEMFAAPDTAETAEQSLQRLGAMGLGGETGSLLPPLGIRSSDEVDPETGASVADRVAATYGMPGEKTATRAPDTEDFTGGVPKNVIDMGANAAATLHRLDPALKGAVAAYPDEQTRAGAEQIRQGLRGSGLPLAKQLEAFEKGISGPASQRNTLIAADAQKEKFRETRDELTEKDEAGLQQVGRDDADKFAMDNKIYDTGKALRAGDTILDVIDKPGADDAMIASELMTFQNVKGTPSDTDLKLAFGIPFASTLDQALDTISKMVKGGMGPVQREAIKSYIATKSKELERGAFEYLDQAHARAAGPNYNERSKKAYLQTIKGSVPGYLYNRWLDTRKERDEGSAGDRGKKTAELSAPSENADLAEMSDFDLELEGAALENDLDPAKIRRIIGPESGGDPKAVSSAGASGVLQIMPDHLKRMGIEPEEFRKLSATEQLPYVMRFFKDNGITSESSADDYALAVGASDPKWRSAPDNTVIYPKGSAAWKQNPAWRPADGGDITKESMLRFYGLRGGGKGGDKGAATKLPEPKTPAEKRYLELLKKRGG